MKTLHMIAFETAKELLSPVNKNNKEYLDELFRFSLIRKQNFLDFIISIEKFHYGFFSFLKCNFNRNPFKYFLKDGLW